MLRFALIAAGAGLAALAVPAAAHDHGKGAKRAKAATCAPIPANAADTLFNQWNSAWATKNPDAVTALFAQRAVLLPTVSKVPRTDKAGIRDYFVSFLKNNPVGRIDSSTVMEGCNQLVRVGQWSVDFTDAQTAAKSSVSGRYTFIYKYEGGAWKVAHLHSSLNPAT
jgi:uncharacterized protein (TIGR02246 family)